MSTTYRNLKAGEQIRKGDEFYSTPARTWRTARLVGTRCQVPAKYRRPVKARRAKA